MVTDTWLSFHVTTAALTTTFCGIERENFRTATNGVVVHEVEWREKKEEKKNTVNGATERKVKAWRWYRMISDVREVEADYSRQDF